MSRDPELGIYWTLLLLHFRGPYGSQNGGLCCVLKVVGNEAKCIGFQPQLVLNAGIETPERRRFALRLAPGMFIEDDGAHYRRRRPFGNTTRTM